MVLGNLNGILEGSNVGINVGLEEGKREILDDDFIFIEISVACFNNVWVNFHGNIMN